MDNVIDIEEYKRIKELKNQIDNNEITNDNIELNDLEQINNLYYKEIDQLTKEVKELRLEKERLEQLKGGCN